MALETKVMVNGQVGGKGQESVYLNLPGFFVLVAMMLMVVLVVMMVMMAVVMVVVIMVVIMVVSVHFARLKMVFYGL